MIIVAAAKRYLFNCRVNPKKTDKYHYTQNIKVKMLERTWVIHDGDMIF